MVDYPLVLSRLRPTSEYHLKGSGFSYADIGDWRDPNTSKPSDAECVAEWAVYQAEKTAQEADLAAKQLDFAEMIGEKAETAITQLNTAINAVESDIAIIGGSPTNAQVIAVVGRMLAREKADYQLTKAIVKAFARLADVAA